MQPSGVFCTPVRDKTTLPAALYSSSSPVALALPPVTGDPSSDTDDLKGLR